MFIDDNLEGRRNTKSVKWQLRRDKLDYNVAKERFVMWFVNNLSGELLGNNTNLWNEFGCPLLDDEKPIKKE